MDLDYNWINLLILFGAIQGLGFSLILVFNKHHPGSRHLSIFMLVLAYNGFETFTWSSGLSQYFLFFEFYPFVIIFLIGPSFYLYVRRLLHPGMPVTAKTILKHYSPAIFQFVVRTGINVFYFSQIDAVANGVVTVGALDTIYWRYSEPLSVIVFLFYLGLSVNEYRDARKTGLIKGLSKDAHHIVIHWIRALVISLSAMSLGWAVTVIAPYFSTFIEDSHYYPIEIGLVFFIYWVAIVGYHKTRSIYPKKSTSASIMPEQPDYYLKKLVRAMDEDRVYLDPELNVNKLSKHTGIPARIISAVLNQHAKTNFNDFINSYRIREVQSRLLQPDLRHLTISGIALESGFNSQATFQRAFKNGTGMSPRDYLQTRLPKTG